MVTSVTPEASAIVLCVMISPVTILARYSAEAAKPMGSFPERICSFSACFRILIAYRFVFSDASGVTEVTIRNRCKNLKKFTD